MRRTQRWLYWGRRIQLNGKPIGPSSLVIKSQSVKTAKAGGQRGYERGKRGKGCKRQLVVDSQGLPVEIAVTPANVPDTVGGRKALSKAWRWLFRDLKGKVATIYAENG